MIYRVLGVLSLAIGGIFGIVTLLVLLPFLDNFNFSLLILAGVFAVLAYVFLAIGLQLFHPPGGRRERTSGQAEGVRAEAMIVAATSGPGSGPVGSGPDPDVATPPAEPELTIRSAEPEPTIRSAEPEPTIRSAEPAAVSAKENAPSPKSADAQDEAGEAPHVAHPVESVRPSGAQTQRNHDGSSNGGSQPAASAPARAGFKKPGAVVPRD